MTGIFEEKEIIINIYTFLERANELKRLELNAY